jgi:hypothetical protein
VLLADFFSGVRIEWNAGTFSGGKAVTGAKRASLDLPFSVKSNFELFLIFFKKVLSQYATASLASRTGEP